MGKKKLGKASKGKRHTHKKKTAAAGVQTRTRWPAAEARGSGATKCHRKLRSLTVPVAVTFSARAKGHAPPPEDEGGDWSRAAIKSERRQRHFEGAGGAKESMICRTRRSKKPTVLVGID